MVIVHYSTSLNFKVFYIVVETVRFRITKLVEEIKYNQCISFFFLLSEVELVIRRKIMPKIMIHFGKIKLI